VVTRTAAVLASRGSDSAAITAEVERDVVARLDEAFAAARASAWPDAEGADNFVYSN
jgi:TPP-dependent pyruvate/acetoin dehydrogenase alpha subunit